MEDKELIRALRCISTVGNKDNCKECRFCIEELLPEHLWEMTGGEAIFRSCDVDRIGIEAADRLEELLGEKGE